MMRIYLRLKFVCFFTFIGLSAFAQMVPPTLELPAANDTFVSASSLLQTSNHGDAIIEFEIDSVADFSSPAMQSVLSFSNNWGDKEQGRVTFLQYNTKYYLRARSAMDGDTSDWTSTRAFRTTAYPILINPKNNTANGVSAFAWNDAGSLTYYLQVDTTADFSSPFAHTINIADTAFAKYGSIYAAPEKLLYGKKHYWRVKAFHHTDTSLWSPVWSFSLPEKTTLKSPATNITNQNDNINLEWNGLWDAQFYQLQYDTLADFSSVVRKDTLVKGPNTTKTTVDNLYFGRKYYWHVRAIYAKDTSAWSEAWNFETIEKLTLTYPADNKTGISLADVLSWNRIGSGTHYQAQTDSSESFNSPQLFDTVTTSNSVQLQNRMYATTYFWRSRIVNKNDSSQWSEVRKFTTIARETAQNLIPTNNTTNLSINSDFTVVNVMAGNHAAIEIDTTVNFNSPLLIRDTLRFAESERYPRKNIKGLRFAQKYYWRNKNFNNNDSTNWSPLYTFTTTAKPMLEFPYNNQANFGTETNIVVKALSGAEYYIWEIDTTANFNSPALRTDTSSETTVDPGGEFYFNKWYYWRFKGVNSYDTSNWSDTWTFQSTTNVYQFQPANKSVNISNKPLLDFGGISGATGYQYFLSTDSSFKNDKPVNVIGQANTRFIVNVMYGATYYWKVRAYHAKDTSTWSATWTFTTKNAPVIASPNLTSPKNNAINVPPGKVTFTWNANGVTAGIFDFQLAYTNDFSTTVVSGENLPNTSAAINGIKENLEYFWRVRTHKDTLVSQWSTVYKFTTAQSVGFADEVAAQNDFKIYPNPATQILYIASPENALVQQIILQQMNGKILYSENNNQTNFTSINIEKLKPGIYIIGIRTNNGLIYKRFVKQ